MANFYNNIPSVSSTDSANVTRNNLNNFYGINIQVDANAWDALLGFFESNGFSKSSSEVIVYQIFYQSNIDGYDPMAVVQNIKSLNQVALNELVTAILNFNRYKTSVLGLSVTYKATPAVSREIVA